MSDMAELLTLTADIVSAHVTNNTVAVGDLPTLISNVYASLSSLGLVAEPNEVKQEPAVSVRSSIKPDYIVCLEDGKKLKMLKRHLMTSYNMTPDAYRNKWDLPADYPMVAPNYAAQRRSLAIKIGLGSKRAISPAPAPVMASSAPGDAAAVSNAAKTKSTRGRAARQAANPEPLTISKPPRRRKESAAAETAGG